MSLAIKVTGVDVTLSKTRVTVTLTPSGNYVAGGDTIDFSTVQGAADGPEMFLASSPFINGDISTSSSAGVGWIASAIPGTTLQNGKVKFIVSSTGAEVAAGAYPAGLLADPNISGEFVFEKFV